MVVYEVNPWGGRTPEEISAHIHTVTGEKPKVRYAKAWYDVRVMLLTDIPLRQDDPALVNDYLIENRRIRPSDLFTEDQLPLQL